MKISLFGHYITPDDHKDYYDCEVIDKDALTTTCELEMGFPVKDDPKTIDDHIFGLGYNYGKIMDVWDTDDKPPNIHLNEFSFRTPPIDIPNKPNAMDRFENLMRAHIKRNLDKITEEISYRK